jgi:hypothetical protein
MEEVRNTFEKMEKALEKEQDDFWNSLTKEQQLLCFCAVVRRIYDGEYKEKKTYRGMLYDKFGFGPESYLCAQLAGFLSIHNELYDCGE